ncbi:hypothetical protein GCM10027277_05510 [Pseudoduganella ginsengisoli]|uniref:TonB C-terminal domain-containing protein n=1 Tax=Pseudoduganella ginsengisoli TaxID=1462440 RepID=A0A6L6Q3J5_9BURK|nr:hypothetical protein [Pseudoduganella ginsengisoli]MTW04250.1 hypothetical protein [Pseudoduganella ginsengisoli]
MPRNRNSVYYLEPLISGGTVSFNKAYKDLTPDEQQEVRRWFTVLQDDDVPPYPAKGTTELYKAIYTAQGIYYDSGELWMDVLIDEQGTPVDVMVRRSPGKEISEFAANVLLVSKFTPAKCGGKPCAMRFPVRVNLKLSSF